MKRKTVFVSSQKASIVKGRGHPKGSFGRYLEWIFRDYLLENKRPKTDRPMSPAIAGRKRFGFLTRQQSIQTQGRYSVGREGRIVISKTAVYTNW